MPARLPGRTHLWETGRSAQVLGAHLPLILLIHFFTSFPENLFLKPSGEGAALPTELTTSQLPLILRSFQSQISFCAAFVSFASYPIQPPHREKIVPFYTQQAFLCI